MKEKEQKSFIEDDLESSSDEDSEEKQKQKDFDIFCIFL